MRTETDLPEARLEHGGAETFEEARASSRLAGADDFVSKPIESHALLGAVGRALDLDWIVADGAEAPAQVQARAESPVAPPPSLRVLAVDDNPANKRLLSAMVEGLDVELMLASNGAEAIEAWAGGDFDLVLMDVRMPGMGGVEATRAIRLEEARTGRRRTPIVALSGDAQAHHQAEYRAAGMDACLAKPIELRRLYALIEAVADGAPPELRAAG